MQSSSPPQERVLHARNAVEQILRGKIQTRRPLGVAVADTDRVTAAMPMTEHLPSLIPPSRVGAAETTGQPGGRRTIVIGELGTAAADAYWRWPAEQRLHNNAVISVRGRHIERPLGPQAFSIKMIRGGCEEFQLRGRRVVLEEGGYLVLNGGQAYASRIGAGEAESFHVSFSAALVRETLNDELTPADRILERGQSGDEWFAEQLFEHDRVVSPVLRYIHRICQSGHADEAWYEEQLRLLLTRLLVKHREVVEQIARLPAIKRSTKVEVYRRLVRAKDHILSNYDQPISIRDIGEVSCLSISHLHVLFKEMFGTSPHQFLQRKRIAVACRLMEGDDTMSDIAARVGMDSRSTFFRAFRRIQGVSPQAFRRQASQAARADTLRSAIFPQRNLGS